MANSAKSLPITSGHDVIHQMLLQSQRLPAKKWLTFIEKRKSNNKKAE